MIPYSCSLVISFIIIRHNFPSRNHIEVRVRMLMVTILTDKSTLGWSSLILSSKQTVEISSLRYEEASHANHLFPIPFCISIIVPY